MFTGRTPESLLPRSDSRNPATTCKGMTKSGRPCRRPIDAKTSTDNGVIAVVSVVNDNSDDEDIGAAAYFCWQHKDQAEQLAAQTSSGPATQLYPLKERNSIDTLVERLGVLDVNELGEDGGAGPKRKKKERRASGSSKPHRRVNRPPTWDTVQGPLMSVPSDLMAQHNRPSKPVPQRRRKQGFWSSLCCGSADDINDEDIALSKPHPHVQQAQNIPLTFQSQSQSQPHPHRRRRSSASTPSKPPSQPHPPPLHPSIPAHIPPPLASTLLAELGKPISPHDDEGYIYIFWLTPETAGPAPPGTASALLAPPGARGGSSRRTSDVMREFAVGGGGKAGGAGSAGGDKDGGMKNGAEAEKRKETILLKIGRANNVHRRMNEWTRQCGYDVSLIRYYPYIPSSPSSSTPSPSPSPARHPPSKSPKKPASATATPGVRKVPHAMRVERLIHLELAAQRVIKQCEACGKTHREWFEVEASREGVRGVDEVVRRWVGWDEGSVR